MVTGYFIRQHKSAWCVIEQDEQYRERIVESGLTFKKACEEWREKVRILMAKPRHERVPDAGGALPIERGASAPPQQLPLKFL